MSLFDAISISASGLTAERERVEVTVSNLANARTTRTEEGGPYRRQDVVFEAVSVRRDFEEELREASGDSDVMGVRVGETLVDPRPPQKVHDPGHPDADDEGYVLYPNVNPVEEVVNLISAARSFEANLTAIGVTRQLIERSIELGK